MDWRGLAKKVGGIVDDTFGENVKLVPWSTSEYSEGGPDPTRPSVDAVGIFSNPAARVQDTFAGFRVERDITLSLEEDAIPHGFGKDDRVQLVDREGAYYVVTSIEPGPTGRSLIHLTILADRP